MTITQSSGEILASGGFYGSYNFIAVFHSPVCFPNV